MNSEHVAGTELQFAPWQRLLLGVAGFVGLSAGVVAVFATENGSGSAALIAAGALLIAIAFIGRLAGLKFGGAEATFRSDVHQTAVDLEDLAEEERAQGDDTTARLLDEAAKKLAASAHFYQPLSEKLFDFRTTRELSRALAENATAILTDVLTRVDARAQMSLESRCQTGFVWDAIIESGPFVLLVDVSYVRPDSRIGPRLVVERLGRAALERLLSDQEVSVLLLSNVDLRSERSTRGADLLDRLPFAHTAAVGEPGAISLIEAAVRSALQRSESSGG